MSIILLYSKPGKNVTLTQYYLINPCPAQLFVSTGRPISPISFEDVIANATSSLK